MHGTYYCPLPSQTGLQTPKNLAENYLQRDVGLWESDKAVTLLETGTVPLEGYFRQMPAHKPTLVTREKAMLKYMSLNLLFSATEKGSSVLISILVQAPHCTVGQQTALNLNILSRMFSS